MPGLLEQAAQSAAAVPPPQAGQPGSQMAGPPAPQQQPPPQPGPPGPAGPPGAAAAAPAPAPQSADPNMDPVYDPGDIDVGLEDATDEENREYEKAVAALDEMLYEVDNTAKGIAKMIDPNNKIETTTKANLTVLNQLDESLDLDEVVVPQITSDIVDKVSELAEARYGIEYTERDLQATLGATWEGALQMFGIEPQDFSNFMQGFDKGQVDQLRGAYEGFLGGGAQTGPPPGVGGTPGAPGTPATPGAPAGVPGPQPQTLAAPAMGGGGQGG